MADHVVAVVGGGITGLAAAWALTKLDDPPAVVVFDADRLGGKLRTSPFAGLPAVDEGADAFLARVPEAIALCNELGLGDELVAPATGKAYLWWNGAMHRLPEGLVLGVPAGVARLARSDLLSWRGKARAALEPLLPRLSAALDDDNLGALIRSRFGDEVLERLVDPLIGGINAGDADHLSLAASAPQVAEVAARSRSLLIGLRRRALPTGTPPTGTVSSGPAAPVFLTPQRGMASLVGRLVDALTERGVELRTAAPIERIERDGTGWRVGTLDADAVIVATPAHVAAPQLAAVAPRAAALIAAIEHASVAMVTLAFDAANVSRTLDGSGHLIPKPQQHHLTACSWASTKWAHWRRADQVVLRASLGRYGHEASALGGDDELIARALADLTPALGLRGAPSDVRITRWDKAFPQHTPKHLDRVLAIEAALADEAPGLVVAGAAYRGVGIPACIRQGVVAAATVTRHWSIP